MFLMVDPKQATIVGGYTVWHEILAGVYFCALVIFLFADRNF